MHSPIIRGTSVIAGMTEGQPDWLVKFAAGLFGAAVVILIAGVIA